MKTTVCLLVIASLTGSVVCQDFMLNGFGNNLFASKTAYFWNHSNNSANQDTLYTITMGNRICNAIQLNMVSRHAARYVSVDDMRNFTVLQKKLKNSVGNHQYDFIKTWQNTYPEDKANLVTTLGIKEMDVLGKKYGTELFSLFRNGGINRVKLAATSIVRTQTSVKEFFKAIAMATGSANTTGLPTVRDHILRFYAYCQKYQAMSNSPTFLAEMYKFQQSLEFKAVVKDIEERLQLTTNLTAADVKMLYELCATELSIRNQSEWCTIQTDENRVVLEYENDIQDYYSRLYGYSIVAKMACRLVNDVFTELDLAIHNHAQQKEFTTGVFQFGHADTIVEFYAALGLFRDDQPLTADNFRSMKNRQFVGARVDSFSAHAVLILYNCGSTSPGDYAIKLLVNGEPVKFPACNSDTCLYHDVRAAYSLAIDRCDFDEVCGLSGSSLIG